LRHRYHDFVPTPLSLPLCNTAKTPSKKSSKATNTAAAGGKLSPARPTPPPRAEADAPCDPDKDVFKKHVGVMNSIVGDIFNRVCNEAASL
jgi:hypothetical protein